MQFPLIGSCVLFGLYIVIKLVKKELLDALLSVYFALLGAAMLACSLMLSVNGGREEG